MQREWTMMMNERFPCGHENAASNRFCEVCGAARLRKCRLCESPISADAKYCSACGVRLEDDATAGEPVAASPMPRHRQSTSGPASPAEGGDDLAEEETPPWAKGRRWRRDDVPSPAMDDQLEEDEGAGEDRRRRPFLSAGVVAATLAVVLAVGSFSLARQAGFLDRVLGKADGRAPAPLTQSERPADVSGVGVVSPVPAEESRTVSPPTTEGAPPAPSAPAPAEDAPAAEPKSPGAVGLPPREPATGPATARGENSPETSQATAGPSQASEERMAAFLVEELGPALAAEKALSNAGWYGEDRSEHAYWQRVAEAVRRRGER